MENQRSSRSRVSAADRLDSWKEIASFLRRSVRTVQRWEATENLPVHRHLHKTKGTVYAYASDLEAWLSHRTVNLPEAPVFSRSKLEEPSDPKWLRMPELLPTESLGAYRHYLQGRRNLESRTRAGFEKGIDCFRRAIQEDAAFTCGYNLIR